MTRRLAMSALAGLVVAVAPLEAPAQDTVVAPGRMSFDTARLAPLFRMYDVLVLDADSVIRLGERTVAMLPGSFAGTPGWQLVETRTGTIAAMDSLWLAEDGRPLYWSSTLGAGRLTAQFVSDTMFGMLAIGRVSRNLVLPLGPNVLVSPAMVEVVLGATAIHDGWADSATALEITPPTVAALGADLLVVAREDLPRDYDAPRATRVVALRAQGRQLLVWLDVVTGIPVRMQQALGTGGRRLEYRLREIPPLRLPLYWP